MSTSTKPLEVLHMARPQAGELFLSDRSQNSPKLDYELICQGASQGRARQDDR